MRKGKIKAALFGLVVLGAPLLAANAAGATMVTGLDVTPNCYGGNPDVSYVVTSLVPGGSILATATAIPAGTPKTAGGATGSFVEPVGTQSVTVSIDETWPTGESAHLSNTVSTASCVVPPTTTTTVAKACTASASYLVNGRPVSDLRGQVAAGDSVAALVTVKGDDDCSVRVYLSAFKLTASGNPSGEQLYSQASATFGPGAHELGPINVPTCWFQVDAFTRAIGGNNVALSNAVGGTTSCVPVTTTTTVPVTTTKPPTPTTTTVVAPAPTTVPRTPTPTVAPKPLAPVVAKVVAPAKVSLPVAPSGSLAETGTPSNTARIAVLAFILIAGGALVVRTTVDRNRKGGKV